MSMAPSTQVGPPSSPARTRSAMSAMMVSHVALASRYMASRAAALEMKGL